MTASFRFAVAILVTVAIAKGQDSKLPTFQRVPQLPYKVTSNPFQSPIESNVGETSAVASNSRGHVLLLQRVAPSLTEFEEGKAFTRSLKDGLVDQPQGLPIDAGDNIWTTDVGNHLVIKLSPEGCVLRVLGRENWRAEAPWLFNKVDVDIGKNGDIHVADGDGNSRIVKFDRTDNFIKTWRTFGLGSGEFDLPHLLVIDNRNPINIADRVNEIIQIFDENGMFVKQWTGIVYPYDLFLTSDQHIWMADGGYDRIIELDQTESILGAIGKPGHTPGQLAWAHWLAIGSGRKLYVADVLNWRFQVFIPRLQPGEWHPTCRHPECSQIQSQAQAI
jgi:hypothetical protein